MSLKFVINRIENNEFCTIGELEVFDENNTSLFKCFTLENPKIGAERKKDLAIPAGEYTVDERFSPKFSAGFGGRKMYWVYGGEIPQDAYILIHGGNTEKDTEGCILLGTDVVRNSAGQATSVTQSKVQVNNLFKVVDGCGGIAGTTLTINNNF